MTEPSILPSPPENDEHRTKYGRVEIELCGGYAGIVKSVKSAPAAPAIAADIVNAIILYFITFIPQASAAIRLSRTAIIARPVRLRTRFSTITSATIIQNKARRKGGDTLNAHRTLCAFDDGFSALFKTEVGDAFCCPWR